MMWMIGLLGVQAQAGDVWVVVDDPQRHVEVPAEWFVSDGSSARLDTASGSIDLVAETRALQASGEGAARAWPLRVGQIRLEHRGTVPAGVSALSASFGSGLTLSMDLADGAGAALGPIDASLQSDGLELHLDREDLLEPLRRSPPVDLFRTTDKKGRPVVVSLR